jgi:type IV pilus assembly protein PilA
LIEILVVLLVMGLLAAIAIPNFLNQRSKANDAEAKGAIVTAIKAMEICGTDHGGDFSPSSCDKPEILSIEPKLNDAAPRLTVDSTADSYTIEVRSARDPADVAFTAEKTAAGTVTRSCSVASGADPGGCQNGVTW